MNDSADREERVAQIVNRQSSIVNALETLSERLAQRRDSPDLKSKELTRSARSAHGDRYGRRTQPQSMVL
jgi:hypothetical protein